VKRARRETPVPKAWRDALVPAPTTPRDPEGASAWVALLRVYGSLGGLAFCIWLLLHVSVNQRAVALAFAVAVAALVAFAPARWFAAPLVRRGSVRRAFRLLRLTSLDAERRSAAIVAGALALAHRAPGSDHSRELSFLEQQLGLAEPRGARGIVAYALLRALRGDPTSARSLFEMIHAAAPRIFDSFTRRIALTWLGADCARRGDFGRLARLFHPAQRSTRRAPAIAKLLGAIAHRLLQTADADSDRALRRRHWFAPHRRATRALLERALSVPRLPRPELVTKNWPSQTPQEALVTALIAHKAWLAGAANATEPAKAQALLDAARAWDALEASAVDLDEADPKKPSHSDIEQLLATATSDLAMSSLERDIPLAALAGKSETLERAYDQVCERLFREIDAHVEPVSRRARDDRARNALEEWVEWAGLHRTIERAHRLGGDRVRHGAFAELHTDLTNYAVWLYNVRRQHLVAHTIFHWLLAEARYVNDEKAIALCAKNIRVQPE
jgi:hypothetical protein